MNLTAIAIFVACTLSAAAGFGGAWNIQQGRIDSDEKDRLTIAIESERLVSRVEQNRSAQSLAAQNARALRESGLRADAIASQRVVVGMRNALAVAVQTARSDPATCPDAATSISVVLAECVGAYQELGEVTDRHVSDIKTLIDSYPKE